MKLKVYSGSGSIDIWALMSYAGVKWSKLFKGRLDSESNEEISEDFLILSFDLMEKDDAIFQQDAHRTDRLAEQCDLFINVGRTRKHATDQVSYELPSKN